MVRQRFEDEVNNILVSRAEGMFDDDPDFIELTEIQQKFIYAYGLRNLAGWSQAKCYKYASPREVTHASAHVASRRLMVHEKIKPFLRKWDKIIATDIARNADRILEEEASLAFSDITEYIDDDGMISGKELKALPRPLRAAIKEFEAIEIGGVIRYKIKVYDKSAALGRLEKINGMNAPEKVINTNVNVGLDENTDPKEAAALYSQLLKGDDE